MAEVLFFFAAIVVLAGAFGTVGLRNPFYSVLALVCHLLGLAALFLLLRAEFVAAARDAAEGRPFEISGWTLGEVDDVRARAAELGLDRLVLTRLGTIA